MVFSYIGTRTKNDPRFYKFVEDEADRMRREVQQHVSDVVISQVKVGGIGAVVPTADTCGVYL